jgi:EAL domain-containing protein (putative c-di-GMP-specific phosphodiesterase class I)
MFAVAAQQDPAMSMSDKAVMHAIDTNQLRVVFQPIMDLKTGMVFAHEVLVRSGEFRSPPELFDAAVAANCTGALGRIIRRLAVERCDDMPLFMNVHPNEFDEGWLVRPDDPVFHHEPEVYLEVTESVPLSHFQLVGSVLREVRGRGVYLAVDDLGAGYSNLKYIADLAPEVVKLDRALISNLADDKRLHRLVTALVRLCEDLGARVVAEGIEQLDELHAARDAGAHFGQGYLIAKPSDDPVDVTGGQFGL